MHIYVYVYVHIYKNIHIYICIYTYKCVYMQIYVYVYVYTVPVSGPVLNSRPSNYTQRIYTYVCLHIFINIHTLRHKHKYTRTQPHANAHTCKHTQKTSEESARARERTIHIHIKLGPLSAPAFRPQTRIIQTTKNLLAYRCCQVIAASCLANAQDMNACPTFRLIERLLR